MADTLPIRAFLSYAHADDDEFGIVDPLTSKLKALVRAKSGRGLEIFVDRESIGWGTDWRKSISSSVENATIFIPLLSANYLDSDRCREEFLAFHSKAEVLGVTELLLPILIFKSPLFGPDNADEVAQISEALQYKCIETPLLAGFSSPEWLQCMRDLSESLISALDRAEAALAREVARAPTLAPSEGPSGEPPSNTADVEESGLAELMESLQTDTDRMNAAAERLSPALEQLGNAPTRVGALVDEPTPKQVQWWTMRLAHEIKLPAATLEEAGRELFDATKGLGETLYKLERLTEGLDLPEVSEPFVEGRRTLIASFGDLREVARNMDELLRSMRPAEVLSVPLRKALQPARRGLTAVGDSLRLIESWQSANPA